MYAPCVMANSQPRRFRRLHVGASFDAAPKTNGRCRSATTVKMSSFLFLLPHSLMPQTDGVERGMEGMGERDA